jgi:hypothetical protein
MIIISDLGTHQRARLNRAGAILLIIGTPIAGV